MPLMHENAGLCRPHAGADAGLRLFPGLGFPSSWVARLHSCRSDSRLPKPHEWAPSLELLGSTCHVYILQREDDFSSFCLRSPQPCGLGETGQLSPALCCPYGTSARRGFVIWRVKEEMESCRKLYRYFKVLWPRWPFASEKKFRSVLYLITKSLLALRFALLQVHAHVSESTRKETVSEMKPRQMKDRPTVRTLWNFMGSLKGRDHFNTRVQLEL